MKWNKFEGHFILAAGLRAGQNSPSLNQWDCSISPNPAQGLYTWGRPDVQLILHVTLGGMVLVPNHPAPREQSRRGFWWPDFPSRAGWGFSVGLNKS